jgi:hypothetical protein
MATIVAVLSNPTGSTDGPTGSNLASGESARGWWRTGAYSSAVTYSYSTYSDAG